MKLISLIAQSIFTGGCLVILFVLVPFWRQSSAADFLLWFSINASNIAKIMLPLEVTPLVLSIVAFYLVNKKKEDGRRWWLLNLIGNIVILLLFFIYFKPVNSAMASGDIAAQQLVQELEQWRVMHIVRTMLTGIATLFCTLGLRVNSMRLKI